MDTLVTFVSFQPIVEEFPRYFYSFGLVENIDVKLIKPNESVSGFQSDIQFVQIGHPGRPRPACIAACRYARSVARSTGAGARKGWLACLQGGPERAVVRVREVGLGLRCGWCQRLHLLGEVAEERPERGAERGGESALGQVRPVSLHGRR